MSVHAAGAKFIEALAIAHARHDENNLAQTARIARLESQWLELQGEWRGAMKKLLDGQKEMLRVLKANGSHRE